MKAALTILCFLMALQVLGQPNQFAEISTDQTKLRACSGIGCPVIDVLPKGQRCAIIHTEKLEEISNYGINTWAEIIIDDSNKRGYVYAALLKLIPKEEGIPINPPKTARIIESGANIRTCPDVNCNILFQVPRGSFCEVNSHTDFQTVVAGQSDRKPWYFVNYQGKTGYIHGSLLDFTDFVDRSLTINATTAEVTNDQGEVINTVYKNERFPVIRRSSESQVIRPYGRYYWYLIDLGNGNTGWVFGALTSKANDPVNCQCVDFLKHTLDINGPTKNAFEWGEVLTGQLEVIIGKQSGFLKYQEVFFSDGIKKGDIAIFSNAHPEVHPEFGHIGFVSEVIIRVNGHQSQVLIEGGNHQVPVEKYYILNRCNNVSKKWYSVDQYVSFFRLK